MNRIILIGNGFDLAHGLKTSYADFINWYWGEWGKRLRRGQDKLEDDGLCSFKLNDGIDLLSWAYVFGWYYKRQNPFMPWDDNEVVNLVKQDTKLCKFVFKDFFFREICNSVETKGWVDIENLYYVFLSQKTEYYISPKDANDDMDLLREKLIEYLSSFKECISEDIVKDNLK